MDESLARLLMVIYAVLIPSASALVAYWMTIRERRRIAAAQASEFDELRRALEDLQERVDFTERALTQGRLQATVEKKETTPV